MSKVMNNKSLDDPVLEFSKEICILDKICSLKDKDSYEIDFLDDEDIKIAKLIMKYEIEFTNLKALTIYYNFKGLFEMKELISNAFPSCLNSFELIANYGVAGKSYMFNKERFK